MLFVCFQSCCCHKRHNRLDNLRTLILADNCLRDISLYLAVSDNVSSISEDQIEQQQQTTATPTPSAMTPLSSETMASSQHKSRLMFANLSMMDVSNNSIRSVPINMKELANLSVLNLSGNSGINDLPPEMGLLTRLWNLNTRYAVHSRVLPYSSMCK